MSATPGCVRVVVDERDVELVADRLWFLGATAVGERRADSRRVELEAGFATATDAEAVAAAVGGDAVDIGFALDAALDAWKAHARPVRVAGLHIRYPWLAPDDDPPAPGERCVIVDPSRAFGSGSHPSTVGCLRAVWRWAGPGVAVFDVGCGSGILAVAAAVAGAAPVVAVDIDPVSVATTAANAARNGVDVTASEAAVADVDGRFDLVLANIGAATLQRLLPDLLARVAPGGRLVLAGLLADQVAPFTDGYAADVDRVDGWATVVLSLGPPVD